MNAPKLGTPVAALFSPALLPRLLRLCPRVKEVLRVEYDGNGLPSRGRRALLVGLWPQEARRLRSDPILGDTRIFTRRPGAGGHSFPDDFKPESTLLGVSAAEFRPLGTIETSRPALRGGELPRTSPVAVAPRAEAICLLWSPRRERRLSTTRCHGHSRGHDGLWVPDGSLESFLEDRIVRHSSSWKRLQVQRASGGFVFSGDLGSERLPLSVLALARQTLGGGSVFVELGLEIPRLLRSLPVPHPALLALVEDGEVRIRALEVPPRDAASLLRPKARRRALRPSRRDAEGATPQSDPRTAQAASDLARWMGPQPAEEGRGSRRLHRKLHEAFGATIRTPLQADKRVAEPLTRSGWLRHFPFWRLPAAVRRQLDKSARRKLRDPRERRNVIARQSEALALLINKLASVKWREAVSLALPLRAPGEKEPSSTWLNVEPDLDASGDSFSLNALARKGSCGVVGVGKEIYGQLERLYRRAGDQLLASREYRRAAHVLSYLLGEHARAAAVLEQGGFPREAATLYLHLADQPRKAAVALERGNLHAEAARIWMDLGTWQRAARAWRTAGNEAQALAAWRKVVMDLRDAGRHIQAAELLERELEDPVAALEILEACVLSPGPDSLEALERAVHACLRLENRERARELLDRAGEFLRQEAEVSPRRRAALRRLVEWSNRMAWWSRPACRLVDPTDARRAWLAAVELWARVRRGTTTAMRAELDALVTETAKRHGDRCGDPWLAPDTESWLRATALEAKPPRSARTAREVLVEGPSTALCVQGDDILVGTDDGRVAWYRRQEDRLERLEASFDSGSARSIQGLQASETDVYGATDEEVHHFEKRSGVAAGRGSLLFRALQIERTLTGRVQDLALVGSALLRVTTRQVHVLHAVHLRPMRLLLDALEASIAGVAANRRYVGILLNRGREHAEEEALFEVIVFRRRPEAGREEFRTLESFEVSVRRPRRLSFFGPDSDDLLLAADEYLAFLPSRRELARYFELEASSTSGRLPPAQVGGLPSRESVLIAYGDGSLEAIHLPSKKRTFLLDAPGSKLDPLVGFAVEERPPTAWLLHRSGQLRWISGPVLR